MSSMTEVDFKKKCKKEKIKDYCYITTNEFLKRPNILGCNKTEKDFIVYFTNSSGTINEICTLNDENYTFEFIYKLLLFNKELNIGHEKVKIKSLKM